MLAVLVAHKYHKEHNMAKVTPVAPGGQGLPAGVTQDPISGILIYRGQPIPAGSYEGVQKIVDAINNRRPVTFQDYDRNVGAVTRTYDPIAQSQAVGPANPDTVVVPATERNPARGVRDNPANPPNTAAPAPAVDPTEIVARPNPQGNPPDPTITDPAEGQVSESVNPVSTVVDTDAQPVDEVPLASLRRAPENNFVFDPDTGELLPADSAQAEFIVEEQERIQNRAPLAVGGNFTEVFDVETGLYNVENLDTGEIIATGLTEQEAIVRAREAATGGTGFRGSEGDFGDTGLTPQQIRVQEAQQRAINAQAALTRARDQATLSEQRKASGAAIGDGDWRVRLRLAPYATYLYKTPGNNTAGILQPLKDTDGVIFPYTPRIDIQYSADYSAYDLTHNNYRGYFYKGSKVGEVILTADFTAQDTSEANYLLAVIHFFKACTKMFYGKDNERGAPPPLVYLTGLGEYQFNEHACVISNFNYSLPPDVDYIRARSTMASSAGVTQGGNGLLWQRSLAPSATASYNLDSIWARLTGANLPKGAVNYPPAPPNLGQNSPTYVPTKIQMTLTLLPVQSRQQVSQQFSLKEYANGNLLKGGFW
jgi:hypothetical protein